MQHVLRASAVVSVFALALQPASSATFTVDRLGDEPSASACDPGVAFDCSLRGAVTASNATPGKDTIIVPAATYALTVFAGELPLADDVEILGAEGTASVVRQDYSGSRVMSVTAADVTLSNLVISGAETSQGRDGAGIHHSGGGRLVLRHCRVTDNRVSEGSGAGIYSSSGTLVVSDSAVSTNVNPDFQQGAAIYIKNGELNLIRSSITLNEGGGSGGGIAAFASQVDLRNSVIDGNEVDAAAGAGIYVNGGTLTLVNSEITGNHATLDGSGGGIYLRSGATLTMAGSRVEGNSAARDGGGIWTDSTVEILQSTIGDNSAGSDTTGSGGGIYADEGASITVTESLFADNSAVQEGAGILIWLGASATVTNSTFSGNVAGTFGGAIGVGGVLNLSSSTFTGNTDGVSGATIDYSVGTTNLKNTLIDGTCAAFFLNINSQGGNLESPGNTCFLDAPSDQINVTAPNLALDSLDINGGPTFTHALLAGSVAIDGGVVSCPSVDQRGYFRIDGNCDVGAFEDGALMPVPLFTDGFESGDTSAWSSTVQ